MSNDMKSWRVMEVGSPPPSRTHKVPFTCLTCGEESNLGVCGSPLAQAGAGIVFDPGARWMPKTIRCPHCLASLTIDEKDAQ